MCLCVWECADGGAHQSCPSPIIMVWPYDRSYFVFSWRRGRGFLDYIKQKKNIETNTGEEEEEEEEEGGGESVCLVGEGPPKAKDVILMLYHLPFLPHRFLIF